MPPIALVAFDLDDTLYPERAFVRSGFRAVSEYLLRRGIVDRPLMDDLEEAFDAGVRGRTFDHVLAAAGVEPTEALVRTLVQVYRTHRSADGAVAPDIRLHEDADRALGSLAAKGCRLGLVSDGPVEAQQAKVEALGLAGRMAVVILTDAWGREFWKPHPRAFLEMADRLGVPPAACVYVADNPAKDFEGPARAGWHPSVWVRRADGIYRQAETPAEDLVAAVIPSLDPLADLVAEWSHGRG